MDKKDEKGSFNEQSNKGRIDRRSKHVKTKREREIDIRISLSSSSFKNTESRKDARNSQSRLWRRYKKKVRQRSIAELQKEKTRGLFKCSIELLCKVHGISRQSYYQMNKRDIKESYEEEIVLQLVREKRQRQTKVGVKKLYRMLKKVFEEMGLPIGRDRLFNILRRNGLLVVRKRKYIRTTNSNHRFWVYGNLIKGLKVERPNQVVVSDITYIEVGTGFEYLSLLTDVYSRKIIGYDLSESLSIEGSLRALNMGLRKIKHKVGMIHHSDRGIQYCSKGYTKLLAKNKIKISMAEKGNPYENAIAERVNGILKIEFMLEQRYTTKQEAQASIKEAIKIYNEERLHMSIGYKTPDEKYGEVKAA